MVWTSSFHNKSEIFLGDPASGFQNRKLAELSPSIVLEGAAPRLIDEWQEVPPLWDAVRYQVDQSAEKGQYILTGAVSLQALCNGDFTPEMTGEVDLHHIIELILRGGWPGSLYLPADRAFLLPKEYLDAVIKDDIYRVDGIKRDTAKMRLLLRSLARNESATVTNKTLKNDIKAVDDEDIDIETVASYLSVFNRLFLTDNQPPFSSNIRSSVRVKQAEKKHFCDPSLACVLLKATPDSLPGDLETLGFLFESLCECDLRIYAESFGANLYHYQDYSNREIDAVVELSDGRWCAFEIKLGAHQIDQAAENLKTLHAEIASDEKSVPPSNLCVICGLSNAAYRREDGVYVVPITALRN